jgi:hypothetical protein
MGERKERTMCDFVSWFKNEKTGAIRFTTTKQALELMKGRGDVSQVSNYNDLSGHGALKHWLKREGIDVDSPSLDWEPWELTLNRKPQAKLPRAIVKAVKAGHMRYVGISERLLTAAAWRKVREELQRIRMERDQKVTCDSPLSADRRHARAAFVAAHDVFWTAFQNKANRAPGWR